MGRKRHASEYLADSGSVSLASTSKMPSEDEGGSCSVERKGGEGEESGIEGWLLLRLIQSTATLALTDGLSVFRDVLVNENCEIKKERNTGGDSITELKNIGTS